MDASAKQELNSIKKELKSIVDELNSIESGVRRDFTGVGNEKCANALAKASAHYNKVKTQLEKMDLSVLADEYVEAHPELEQQTTDSSNKQQSVVQTESKTAASKSQKTTNTEDNAVVSALKKGAKGVLSWLSR